MTSRPIDMLVAESEGLRIDIGEGVWREDGFHNSAAVLLNGVLLEGARAHFRKLKDGSWRLDLLRFSPAAVQTLGRFRFRAFAGRVREIQVEDTELDRVDPAVSITTRTEVPASMPVSDDFTIFPGVPGDSLHWPVPAPQYSYVSVSPPQVPPPPPFHSSWHSVFALGASAPKTPRQMERVINIESTIEVSASEWTRPWSIRSWRKIGASLRTHDSGFTKGWEKISSTGSRASRLDEALLPPHRQAQDLVRETFRLARQDFDSSTLVQYFDFPEETRAACEQYLSYFSQFLRDLGIDSHIEIKEEAKKVLFSCRPSDGASALEAVRDALAVYLQLPAIADAERPTVGSNEIAVIQLESNIQHLKSQLGLAQVAIRLQEATIGAQAHTIGAQALTLQTLEAAGHQVPRKLPATDAESEPLIGSAISVNKVTKFGITADLPQIVRSLKRRFAKPRS